MKQSASHRLAAEWARIGVLFNVQAARQTPDVERLLLETARVIPDDPRLFIMAATWLARYHRLVARHRLARMVAKLQDAPETAVLGLLLDTVRTMCRTDALDLVCGACRPAPVAKPLFVVDQSTAGLAEFVHAKASTLSREWRLWAEPIELRPDALRPGDWIIDTNPELQVRAVLGGGLRTSVLACLQHDVPSGASEAELARLCSVTRKAMHEALDHLELCGMVRRSRVGRSYQVTMRRGLARIAG